VEASVIYEERRAVLQRGALDGYRRLMLGEVWPALAAAGARPLCLLSGLIGLPAEETYSFTGYPSMAEWEQAQRASAADAPDSAGMSGGLRAALARRSEMVTEEQVRLLHPSGPRPKPETPAADRRAVYGMRRFWIRPRDWDDFVRHSAEGVWQRIEAQDARILGLFRDAAATDPLAVTLLTGYHGPAHWEETRGWRERPAGFPDDLWDLGRRAGAARATITLRSYVCLMTAHWPGQG
jgi:hypothetical protein